MNVMILTPREIQNLVEEVEVMAEESGTSMSITLDYLLATLIRHASDPKQYDPVAITTDIDLVM